MHCNINAVNKLKMCMSNARFNFNVGNLLHEKQHEYWRTYDTIEKMYCFDVMIISKFPYFLEVLVLSRFGDFQLLFPFFEPCKNVRRSDLLRKCFAFSSLLPLKNVMFVFPKGAF